MNPTTKSPEAETETPPQIHPSKALPFTNGLLKLHHNNHHSSPTTTSSSYKECLKNHAASIGGHALDGCGEFMPAPTASPTDPTSLKCAACGCHRNFHRREPDDNHHPRPTPMIEYHPHHRHHPLPPAQPTAAPTTVPGGCQSPGSQSPPPISSTYYPGSAPHMLLALSGGVVGGNTNNNSNMNNRNNSRKRFRTKFSQDQKDKMHEFAEKVGWKLQKSNEESVNGFCREIGVQRGVFKVWMHNNKNTFAKTTATTKSAPPGAAAGMGLITNGNGNGNGNENSQSTSSHNNQSSDHHHLIHQRHHFGSTESNAPTNASSSSS